MLTPLLDSSADSDPPTRGPRLRIRPGVEGGGMPHIAEHHTDLVTGVERLLGSRRRTRR